MFFWDDGREESALVPVLVWSRQLRLIFTAAQIVYIISGRLKMATSVIHRGTETHLKRSARSRTKPPLTAVAQFTPVFVIFTLNLWLASVFGRM